MSVENLVTIDFESDGINQENDEGISAKNNNRNYPKNISDETEVIFNDSNSLMEDRLANESQPLLGGMDHHDVHQIIYNQFPSKSFPFF